MGRPAAFCVAVAFLFPMRGACGNQALVSGAYAATLGAGGATAAERSAFGQNPAALRPGRMGMHLDYHRPYGMDALALAEAGAYLDGIHGGVSAEWRQTRVEDLYCEDGFRLGTAFRLGRPGRSVHFPGALDLGAAWEVWRSRWPDGRASLAWSHGIGAAWRPVRRVKAGAFMLGLPGPGRGDESDPVLQWGLEADSRDPGEAGPGFRQVLRLDFRKSGSSPWRSLVSLSLIPLAGAELIGGFSGPPFQASLGARISWAGWDWRQALRYHRYLGRTWLSGLAYSRAIGGSRPY